MTDDAPLSSPPSGPSVYRPGEIYWTMISDNFWPVRIVKLITSQTQALDQMLYRHSLNYTTSMPDWTLCKTDSISDFLLNAPPPPSPSGFPDNLVEFHEALSVKFNLSKPIRKICSNQMDLLFIPGQDLILQHYFVSPVETNVLLYRPVHALLPFHLHDPDPSNDDELNSALITAIHLSSSWAIGDEVRDSNGNSSESHLQTAYKEFFEKHPQPDSWSLFPYTSATATSVSFNISYIRLGTEELRIGDLIRLNSSSNECMLIDTIRYHSHVNSNRGQQFLAEFHGSIYVQGCWRD